MLLSSYTAQVCKSLRFSGVSVPRDYEQGFQRALWTFQHQRVWCPQREQLVHLRPLPQGGLAAGRCCPSSSTMLHPCDCQNRCIYQPCRGTQDQMERNQTKNLHFSAIVTGASSGGSPELKTDCSGETRLALHIPSSSSAGQPEHHAAQTPLTILMNGSFTLLWAKRSLHASANACTVMSCVVSTAARSAQLESNNSKCCSGCNDGHLAALMQLMLYWAL